MFSTHTPHAGRDTQSNLAIKSSRMFLLTRPMRDVTEYNGKNTVVITFLLTRPMRDVTHLS